MICSLGPLVFRYFTYVYIKVFHRKKRSQIIIKVLTFELSMHPERKVTRIYVIDLMNNLFNAIQIYFFKFFNFYLYSLSFLCKILKTCLILSNWTLIFKRFPEKHWTTYLRISSLIIQLTNIKLAFCLPKIQVNTCYISDN